jgi:phosphoribosylaminoimidazole (AIR) synthetase
MTLIAHENNSNEIIELLNNSGEKAWQVGTIRPRTGDEVAVVIAPH